MGAPARPPARPPTHPPTHPPGSAIDLFYEQVPDSVRSTSAALLLVCVGERGGRTGHGVVRLQLQPHPAWMGPLPHRAHAMAPPPSRPAPGVGSYVAAALVAIM